MIPVRAITDLADVIAGAFNHEQVILFGSYACGTPTEDSDVDVMVVMPYRGPSYRAASRVRSVMDVSFPVDVLVRSPSEVRQRLAINDFFLRDIVEKGLVLHDRHDGRVGQQGRRRLRRRRHSAALAKAQSV